jgi:hypothetical protein
MEPASSKGYAKRRCCEAENSLVKTRRSLGSTAGTAQICRGTSIERHIRLQKSRTDPNLQSTFTLIGRGAVACLFEPFSDTGFYPYGKTQAQVFAEED